MWAAVFCHTAKMFERLLAASLLCALVLAPAHASPRTDQVHPEIVLASRAERAILFTGGDRQTVDAFFRRYGGNGDSEGNAARRDPLLIRDRLPQGAAVRPLPSALDAKLSPLPNGYARVIVGRDIVLLERNSHTILDIMRDVVR
jgi:hypothetical protein